MKKVSLQKQIKDCLTSGETVYKTPEGTIFRAKVANKEEINNRIAIAKRIGQRPKEFIYGGQKTQQLLKDLIDNEEFMYLCLDIEYMQKQYKYDIYECMDILQKKPRGVNFTFNSTYMETDWYYYNRPLQQYMQIIELLPVKYRKKWLI